MTEQILRRIAILIDLQVEEKSEGEVGKPSLLTFNQELCVPRTSH